MNIAVTGSNGFIGSNLKKYLLENYSEINLIEINRAKKEKSVRNEYTYDEFLSLKVQTNIDIFIHLGSPNYDFSDDDSIKLGIEDLTEKILIKLSKYNCKKFIYFSSCKVYGESSFKKTVYSEQTKPKPITDYAKSKLNAENLVIKKSNKYKYNYLIYRLPFVYGKNFKSNLAKILKIIDLSLPIPSISNQFNLKKSFLSIENLLAIINENIKNDKTIDNNTFNLSDLDSISVDDFLKIYKKHKKSRSFIINIPIIFFKILIKIPILNKIVIKIFGSFEIDNKKIINSTFVKIKSTDECLYDLSKN